MQIERALLKGARIDGIGMQFHMFHQGSAEDVVRKTRDFYDPMRLFDVMDTYAKLGKPMQITEITIPAYSEDPGDEETQAEILRTLYRIWFSHRAMKAIIYWNLPDGPKPAYRVVRDLFGKEWRTNFERDVGGQFSFRGFHGTYELEATANGRTVKQEFRLNPAFADRIEIKV